KPPRACTAPAPRPASPPLGAQGGRGWRPCRQRGAGAWPTRTTGRPRKGGPWASRPPLVRGWDLAPALAGAPHYRGGGSAAPSLCVQATGDRPEHRVRGRGGSCVDDLRALVARRSEQSRRVVPRRLESGDQLPHERGGQAVPLLCERVVSGD